MLGFRGLSPICQEGTFAVLPFESDIMTHGWVAVVSP